MSKSSFPWIIAALGFAVLSAILGFQVYNLNGQVSTAQAAAQTMEEKTVATVNNESITQKQLYDRMVAQNGKSILEDMIEERLVAQEAQKAGVTIGDTEITAEIQNLKEQFNIESDAQLEFMLLQSGMTMADFRERVRHHTTIKRILTPQVEAKVTDETIQEYYDQNGEKYGDPAQVHARHILVETEEEAQATLAELQNGGDFAQLAAERSQDPGSKDNGGDLGFFGRGQMVPAFEEAAFELQPGQLSGIVQSNFGFHIIEVLERKEGRIPPLAEVKDQIRNELIDMELGTMVPQWLEEVRVAAAVTNTLENEG